MSGRKNPNPGLDREALHRFWYRKSGRTHKLRIVQTEWADTLGVTNNTLSKAMKQMVADGQIRKIGYCLYAIQNPSTHGPSSEGSGSETDAEPAAARRPMWG